MNKKLQSSIVCGLIFTSVLACSTKKQDQDSHQPSPSPKSNSGDGQAPSSQPANSSAPISTKDFSLKVVARASGKKIGDDACKTSFCLSETGGTVFENNIQISTGWSPFEESCGFSLYRYDSTNGLTAFPSDTLNSLLDKASFTLATSLPGYTIDKNPIIFQTSAALNINGTTWYLKDKNSDLMALLDCRLIDSTNTSDPVGFTKRAVTKHASAFLQVN